MDNQNIRRKKRHKTEKRNPFHKNTRNRNLLTHNMLLVSNTCHLISSLSTHPTPSIQSNNMKRLQRKHIIKPVTSNTENTEKRLSTTQTYRIMHH